MKIHTMHKPGGMLLEVQPTRKPAGAVLSVLVPLYNEEELVGECLRRVIRTPLPEGVTLEIIVVDDASTDQSVEAVREVQDQFPGFIKLTHHQQNRGKGAAVRTAIDMASGDIAIIQDADLEYDPRDYAQLLAPLLAGEADAVFGSRFVVSSERRVLYFWHALANRLLTMMCNMVADLNLTDMETCYKAVRMSMLKSIPIRSDRFGIEPELTIKLSQRQARIYETAIRYRGRTYEEGKKIGFKDAVQTLWVILRFALQRDIYREAGPKILDVLSEAPRFNCWMADTIRPFLGKTVMELGAGIGNLTALLCRGRKRYIASDIDEEHLARLAVRLQNRKQVEAAFCDLQNPEDFVPYESSVDAVVCLNVLEHVEDDLLGMRNLHSVLRPGGNALVLVPEGMSVYGTLDEVLGHCRRYSEAELRGKLESVGFRVEQIIHFNRITRPGWFFNGRVLKRRRFSRFQIFVFDRCVWIWRRIDRFFPWKPTSLIAIAIKEPTS